MPIMYLLCAYYEQAAKLEFSYLKHGLNLKGAKYDGLVTEYSTRVNGNYDKKVLKKFFDNQKEIKKRSQNGNTTAITNKEKELVVESSEILHPDLQNSKESVNWEENRELGVVRLHIFNSRISNSRKIPGPKKRELGGYTVIFHLLDISGLAELVS